MHALEIIATITGIIAVALQAKEKIWAWPLAIVSVGISVFIFYDSRLYSDLGLHVVYVLLNIFGWYIWSKRSSEADVKPTKVMSSQLMLSCMAIAVAGTFILGYGMNTFTNADMAYIDAFTTSTSLVAQYLLAKKYLQNWWFWIVVDIVAIPLYVYKGLYFFAFLFFVYLLLSIWGYTSWKAQMGHSQLEV